MNTQVAGKDARNASVKFEPMSLETLLTLAVAGLILAAALILRTIALGIARLVRFARGAPAPQPEEKPRIGGGLKRVYGSSVAVGAVIAAAIGSGISTLIARLRPGLSEAREAGIAQMIEQPEESGQPEVIVRLEPAFNENGSAKADADADMLFV